jgi:hypothetical protein
MTCLEHWGERHHISGCYRHEHIRVRLCMRRNSERWVSHKLRSTGHVNVKTSSVREGQSSTVTRCPTPVITYASSTSALKPGR